jgi:hypothetical protein
VQLYIKSQNELSVSRSLVSGLVWNGREAVLAEVFAYKPLKIADKTLCISSELLQVSAISCSRRRVKIADTPERPTQIVEEPLFKDLAMSTSISLPPPTSRSLR